MSPFALADGLLTPVGRAGRGGGRGGEEEEEERRKKRKRRRKREIRSGEGVEEKEGRRRGESG